MTLDEWLEWLDRQPSREDEQRKAEEIADRHYEELGDLVEEYPIPSAGIRRS